MDGYILQIHSMELYWTKTLVGWQILIDCGLCYRVSYSAYCEHNNLVFMMTDRAR